MRPSPHGTIRKFGERLGESDDFLIKRK